MSTRIVDSPIGRLLLRAEGGVLCEIRRAADDDACACSEQGGVLEEAKRQLEAYFAGKLTIFSLPLKPAGSAFERAVWQRLMKIPYGSVMTYGQLASEIGKPKAARAVGGACSRNPLLVVVPCHRVIAGSGKLTGFAAGMDAKRALLEIESWRIHGDRIQTQ